MGLRLRLGRLELRLRRRIRLGLLHTLAHTRSRHAVREGALGTECSLTRIRHAVSERPMQGVAL
jgi:hypothetical protein